MRTNQKTWKQKAAQIKKFAEKRGAGLSDYASRTILEYQMDAIIDALEEISRKGVAKPFTKSYKPRLKPSKKEDERDKHRREAKRKGSGDVKNGTDVEEIGRDWR